jgi:hypothetical protein
MAMRVAIMLALALTLAVAATAQDLGPQAPVKVPQAYPENIPNPIRQGGDSIATATLIPALPYSDSGTTAGYVDDYDEVCSYSGGTAPDVVYKYIATWATTIAIDLCGSSYDTKLYVYDDGLNLIACNDDFYFDAPCGVYVSRLENVQLNAGTTYYIIVDGYGTAYGDYVLEVVPFMLPCYEPYPDSEGEPPLMDDYADTYNGGCNTPPDYPFQQITGDADGDAFLSGESGWYQANGVDMRDTDWFVLSMGPQGVIEIAACAYGGSLVCEVGPQDCSAVAVIQSAFACYWEEGYLTITGYDHLAPVWIWFGPPSASPPEWPDSPYAYNIWFSGLEPGVIATEATTWSTVKALYE